MLFLEKTISSMLFSREGGGVDQVLKNSADPVPLSIFWIPLAVNGS